jgi:hypothetical protein
VCAQVKADVAEYGDWRPIYQSLVRESGLDHPLSAARRQTGFTSEVRARARCSPANFITSMQKQHFLT